MRRTMALLLALWAVSASILPHANPVAAVENPSPTADRGYAHPEWLVSGEKLQEALATQRGIKVIALTPTEEFRAGHIPGAVQVDWPEFEIVETSDQRVATWRSEVEIRLTGLGIAPSDEIVIYDGGTFYASRLWWILEQLGHARKSILNGGLPGWIAAGGELQTGSVVPEPGDEPYVGRPNEQAIATITEVEAAVNDPAVVLIDARTADEYAAGHIPGAINIPFLENAEQDGLQLWKSADALRSLYGEAGITEEMPVIAYCTTGVRSAATYFALRLVGYDKIALFTGSFKEWSSDGRRPIE